MEIDLELPSCEQDKLDIRADKDVNIVDVTDEINVEEERVSYPIMSDRVKEVDGLNAEQGIGSDKDVDIVDISYEVNVEEEHVGSPTTSYHVKEVDGLNAEQSVGLDKDVDILDVADEINVVEESVSALTTSEHVRGADGLSAEESVRSGKHVNGVDVPYEINVEANVSSPTTTDHVKEVYGLNAEQRVGSDRDVDIVDVNDEINVDEEHVSSLTSDCVKEEDGFNADQSFGSDKDVDIVDITDEVNVEEEHVTSPITSDHVMEVDGLNAEQSVFSLNDQNDLNNVGVDSLDKGKGVVEEPENGLEFESKEEAYSYYREYARSVGFGITIKASRRSKKSGKFIDIKIACSRFGSKRELGTTVNPRTCITKTDCKASLHIKRKESEKWVVHSFVKEHNHEICPDDFIYAISGRNKKPAIVVPQKTGLQLALDEEDVRVMFEHFMSMQDEDPNFFYAIDFDHEKRLRSVFWVDSKCKRDYSSFCDAVFFDTYYVRNNYKIPFVPIVGVNHHFQYILLGCALIGEETTSAFVWLMRTWLKAVGGQAPVVVITDQDKFLKEAVEDVFTDARHCFCLWHVLTRIPGNLGSINEKETFIEKFSKCIYRSWTVEQFEKEWSKLVDRFELRENEWVHSLYEDRKKWAPTYMQDSFLAGMSTRERSGSITSFFDRYISQEATFKDFIEQYKAFCKDSYDMEAGASLKTQDKQPGLRSFSTFEKQMSTIYTDAVFKKFEDEVFGLASCHLKKEGENEASVIFRVTDLEERQNFIVSWNEADQKVCCLCHSFECRGFLCRHAILVLQVSGVYTIPSHYILKRWTKDAKVRHTVSDGSKRLNCRVQHFNDLCKLAVKLGEEGSLSPDAYHIALQALETVMKHCVDVNNSVRSVLEPVSANHGFIDVEVVDPSCSVAKLSKKKKTYKKRKVQTELDGTAIRLQDSCQQMELMKSRAHKLDNCYVPQQESERGQLNSISPIHEGCYDNQRVTQGQVHSLPTHTRHLGTQQSLQGMLQLQPSPRAPIVHGCYEIRGNPEDMEQSVGSSRKHRRDKHPPK
ncbi:hypothetical protein ACFX2A_024879 [Malus domestica]